MHHRIVQWLEEAAERLRQSHHRELEVNTKADAHDLVTEMDRATEDYFVQQIRHYYPDHQILGEEGLGDQVTSVVGPLWIIDPIDGTQNFVKMKDDFAIMIGIYQDGQPLAGYIYEVMKADLYYGIAGEGVYLNNRPLATRTYQSLSESLIAGNTKAIISNRYQQQRLVAESMGVRAYGAAALEILAVLRGDVSLYFSSGLNPWDFGAGYAIFQIMGYPVTQVDGSPLNLLEKSTAIFAHPQVHQEAIQLLNSID